MEEAEVRSELKSWIRERAGSEEELANDTPILATGLLSSLDVTELILFIESLKGEEVDLDAIEPEVLENVDTLYQAFFKDASS